MKAICVYGATGGIGQAFVRYFMTHFSDYRLYMVARDFAKLNSIVKAADNVHLFELTESLDTSLEHVVKSIQKNGDSLLYCVNAIGVLHSPDFLPEKRLKSLNQSQFEACYYTNTIIPALITKHMAPLMASNELAIMAHLSARVGSISDNRLGGWYAYRASKAALNMIIKTASIEMQRLNKNLAILGVHPGTVNTALSEPFQSTIPASKRFSADDSVAYIFQNIFSKISAADSGKVFAWDGLEIPA